MNIKYVELQRRSLPRRQDHQAVRRDEQNEPEQNIEECVPAKDVELREHALCRT